MNPPVTAPFSSHRLTPQMRAVLQGMERAARAPLHTLPVAQARAAYEAGAGVLELPKAALPRVEDLHIPARDGHALPARLYAPTEGAPLPLLLYLHGGGFTIGSIATHDVLCRELARLAGCMVVSLDSRLAPAHRFPTASNDAWDALQWLAHHGARLGADTARLAVGGDSAGGTLSAVNAILADTRAERGKTTEAHHYANEARPIGYAMTGVCIGVDRSTLDADTLRLLHRVETLDIKLLIRGADRDTRKTELRALVLKAQATAQALDAGDADPLQSIGGAA